MNTARELFKPKPSPIESIRLNLHAVQTELENLWLGANYTELTTDECERIESLERKKRSLEGDLKIHTKYRRTH